MNNYQKAIRVLEYKPDWQRLVCEIASKNPKAVVDAYKRMNSPDPVKVILEMVKAGSNKVECIKHYRNLTGAGLFESKEFVESVHDFSLN